MRTHRRTTEERALYWHSGSRVGTLKLSISIRSYGNVFSIMPLRQLHTQQRVLRKCVRYPIYESIDQAKGFFNLAWKESQVKNRSDSGLEEFKKKFQKEAEKIRDCGGLLSGKKGTA